MSTSSSTALKHWAKIISRWPVDKVRPDTVSFQKLMQQRLHRFANPSTPPGTSVIQGKEARGNTGTLTWNENKELKQVNALYALLNGRFEKEAPLPNSLRNPASNPDYYDQVVAESERAPSRGFMEKITNKLKGMIRLK